MESNNNQKLTDFFGREYDALKGYVKTRIRDTAHSDAEDIIQDVALKLFAGADRYGPIHNVAGFVYRSLKNKIIDVMRSSTKQQSADLQNDMAELVEQIQVAERFDNSEALSQLLEKSIDQLKPAYKSIIVAVDYQGYTYREIAEKTGISIGTLMSRRHRAIGILYQYLEQELNEHKSNTL